MAAAGFFFYFFRKKVCRVFFLHSATSLPSVRQKTLGKLAFAVKGFAECRLPSVTLGKRFAECFEGFVECPWHSAKLQYPVVSDAYTRSIFTTNIYAFATRKEKESHHVLYIDIIHANFSRKRRRTTLHYIKKKKGKRP